MRFDKVIIITQQETLRERPRIHKMSRILQSLGIPFEIWKVGDPAESSAEGMPVRNLMTNAWRQRSPMLRYLVWMLTVFRTVLHERGDRGYFAVGFDSAFPISWIPGRVKPFIFDNLDNIAMSYRMPALLGKFFTSLERWTAFRAEVHTNPSSNRWTHGGENLRVIINTPSRVAVESARQIAQEHAYTRENEVFTLYVNGWLSPTRGIGTLLKALARLQERQVELQVLVAGRPACPDADHLLTLPNVTHLGMVTNDVALSLYYRCNLAYIFYDPTIEINRLAESQKWTDCWATGTPFVSNQEILTLDKFIQADACYRLSYTDWEGLAELIEHLAKQPKASEGVGSRLAAMDFRFWDDEMRKVVQEWVG